MAVINITANAIPTNVSYLFPTQIANAKYTLSLIGLNSRDGSLTSAP
jgi:hypothetical protein